MRKPISTPVRHRAIAVVDAAMTEEVVTEEMQQVRHMIANTVAKREALKAEMQEWYERSSNERFSKIKDIIAIDNVLCELDTHYKTMWDFHNKRHSLT